MEQLQMLDDDDSSSSSSSNSSNSNSNSNSSTSDDDTSDDDTSDDDDNNDNDNDNENDEKSMSNGDSEAPSATTTTDPVHHKKRIKLSLGGKFKVTLSSPKQEPKPKNENKKDSPQSTSIATESGDKSAKITSVSLKPKSNNPPKPITIKTKPPSTKVANTSIETKPSDTTKDQKSKPKITIPKPAASTGAKSKTKDIKRRQSPKLPITSSAAATTDAAPKKRSAASSMRSIRITPMSSPGLLLPKGTPNEVFAQTMATAGYTKESRTKNPHRGSSVQRIVDDMFDSNVKFCVRFPKLVPEELIRNPTKAQAPTATTTTSSSSDPKEESPPISAAPPLVQDSTPKPKPIEDRAAILMKRLKKAFCKTNDKQPDSIASSENSSKPRNNRIPQYSDMIPISLSSEYPDAYIQKRLEYVKQVEERERAIVKMQQVLFDSPDGEARKTNDIPPIPSPPNVPTRDCLRAMTAMEDLFGSDDQQQKSHPLYLPKSKEFVKHLDTRCFHAVDGRYFGLSSNAISDPYFFGPNAPGLSGLSFSGSTGLATASTVGNAGLGPQLFMMPAQPSSSIAAANQKTLSTTASTKTATAPQVSKDLSKSIKPIAKPVA